jgi:soluble lytic murein transglycosylase-like protein
MRLFLFSAFFLLFAVSSVYAHNYCFNFAGKRFGVNPNLLYAVAKVESGFNPYAIDRDSNGSYDYGVMQINSIWYKEIGLRKWLNLKHTCFNIQVGAWIMSQCQERYNNNILKSIACYHSGGGSIRANSNYISAVVADLRK